MAILRTNSKIESAYQARRQIQLMAREAPRLRRFLVEEFRSTGHQVVMALRGGRNYEQAMQSHARHVEAILREAYRRTGAVFRTEYINQLKKGYPAAPETKDAQNVFTDEFSAWVEKNGAAKAAGISATTRAKIRAVIIASEALGEGLDETAKKIMALTSGLISRSRANTISTTEIHAAANFTNEAIADALQDSNPLMGQRVNVWVHTTEPNRARAEHMELDGQEWPAGETIRVGNSDLLYPGDPAGEPEDVINCHCVTLHRYPDFLT